MTFELPIDREKLSEHAETLNALAIERNNLVHHELANFNFDLNATCGTLLVALDDQNIRILEQLKFLSPAYSSLMEINKLVTQLETQNKLLDVMNQLETDAG